MKAIGSFQTDTSVNAERSEVLDVSAETQAPHRGYAPAPAYALAIPDGTPRQIASGWMLLGLGSLVGAGIFAVFLVLSRTPFFDRYFPWVDFFHTALVIHVDLSILIWFLSYAGVFWSLSLPAHRGRLGWAALAGATIGAVALTASAFVTDARPLMSDYIPVLQTTSFLLGLVIFAAGIAMQAALLLCRARPLGKWIEGDDALRFGVYAAAVTAGIALLAFALNYMANTHAPTGRAYFEEVFWSGGHLLQYMYAQLLIVAWLWLAAGSGVRIPLSPRLVLILFAWSLLPAFSTLYAYLAYTPGSTEFHQFFLWLMAIGGAFAIGPAVLAVAYGLTNAPPAPEDRRPQRAALLGSMFLFALGGVLGFLIQGNNVTVPAHYHGCIGAVTLAFMGITYELLPRLGFQAPALRAARWQAYLYAGGESLHVIGLAWAGDYGVFRKVAGAAQGLQGWRENLAMSFMGIGGLIAIVAGVLFLVICFRALFRPDKSLVPG